MIHLPTPSNATELCWPPVPILKKPSESFASHTSATSSAQIRDRSWKPGLGNGDQKSHDAQVLVLPAASPDPEGTSAQHH